MNLWTINDAISICVSCIKSSINHLLTCIKCLIELSVFILWYNSIFVGINYFKDFFSKLLYACFSIRLRNKLPCFSINSSSLSPCFSRNWKMIDLIHSTFSIWTFNSISSHSFSYKNNVIIIKDTVLVSIK